MTTQEHEQELADLHTYFATAKMPETPFPLNKYMIVHDVQLLIDGETSRIESYKGGDVVRDSLFKHLRELKALCFQSQ